MTVCSSCGRRHRRHNQRLCLKCHAEVQRAFRSKKANQFRAMRRALKKYTLHLAKCPKNEDEDAPHCTCGLDRALRL